MRILVLNPGLKNFLEKKKLSTKVILDFVSEFKILDLTSLPRKKVCLDDLIQENWSKFCTWVDKGIKSGTIKGRDVKLYDDSIREQEIKRIQFIKERKKEQRYLLNQYPDYKRTLIKELLSLGDISGKVLKKYKATYKYDTIPPLTPCNSDRINRHNVELAHLIKYDDVIDWLINNNKVEEFKKFVQK